MLRQRPSRSSLDLPYRPCLSFSSHGSVHFGFLLSLVIVSFRVPLAVLLCTVLEAIPCCLLLVSYFVEDCIEPPSLVPLELGSQLLLWFSTLLTIFLYFRCSLRASMYSSRQDDPRCGLRETRSCRQGAAMIGSPHSSLTCACCSLPFLPLVICPLYCHWPLHGVLCRRSVSAFYPLLLHLPCCWSLWTSIAH